MNRDSLREELHFALAEVESLRSQLEAARDALTIAQRRAYVAEARAAQLAVRVDVAERFSLEAYGG